MSKTAVWNTFTASRVGNYLRSLACNTYHGLPLSTFDEPDWILAYSIWNAIHRDNFISNECQDLNTCTKQVREFLISMLRGETKANEVVLMNLCELISHNVYLRFQFAETLAIDPESPDTIRVWGNMSALAVAMEC